MAAWANNAVKYLAVLSMNCCIAYIPSLYRLYRDLCWRISGLGRHYNESFCHCLQCRAAMKHCATPALMYWSKLDRTHQA